MSKPVGADEPEVMDVMVRSFVTAEPEDTLGELAERLSAADAGSALVVEYGRLRLEVVSLSGLGVREVRAWLVD